MQLHRNLPCISLLARAFPFRWNRNGALDLSFIAFSSREPVSTSLENALACLTLAILSVYCQLNQQE
ncbi:hypothetical protein FDV58_35515 [Bradyrhizobium elkanii]|uniref:Uncharacterized protein n=1 Tax=Bradyrhizobium elkanii TaxID=29448 RepID=A0A4U6RHQ3_BRAEL|nr:hypothetical protein [Bradyrhizobium sp. BR2003]TKV73819.1 hypothetical protein FDV58_35515 [Bradyrhizobium elkanii]